MSDAAPATIGSYKVIREIGRGGMGVVYLARDTKLDRDVAIKCLPPEVAEDRERLDRFEREAKTLASLNHPNIAGIYGVEEQDGRKYLILEYVPGDTLSEALDHGPMPVSEALPVAKQIAEAIESAHEHGIIHRDLKPANIKFASDDDVKVLDFGLAKAFEPEPSNTSEAAASPTYVPTNTPTMPGVVLGTAGYLSPEQARGRPVDKRSDIFSFGCVLFEMLAGKTIFAGETVADSIGATLHKDPNWDELPDDTPPTILLLLRRCLTKDRKRRLHDIADARVEIEDAISDPTSSSLNLATAALAAAGAPSASQSRARIAIGLVVGALLTAAALILPDLMAPDVPPPITRLSLNVPYRANAFGYRLAVSPDSRTIIISGDDETGQPQLFLRQLERTELTPLPDLVDQGDFTCSPDGQWIAYRTRSEGIRRAAVDGGPPSTLCEADFGLGMHWSPDGWIYFSEVWEHRIMRVRENGGEPEVVAAIEIDDGPQAANLFLSPLELPGGAALLCVYAADISSVGNPEIRAYSLVDDTMKIIVENAGHPHYTSTGHLVFLRDATLMAAPFDAKKLELTGPAVSLVEGIAMSRVFPVGAYAMSGDGTLYYMSDEVAMGEENIVALDLEGEQSPLVSFTTEEFDSLRSSPDGTRLAVTQVSFDGGIYHDIWLVDVARDIPSLLTTEAGRQYNPLWSPDGQWVYYMRRSSGDEEVTDGVYGDVLISGASRNWCSRPSNSS